jgi:tetratricopeptide (TPR) repeat protein
VRFEEVSDIDGSVLVRGLHPSITVVSAKPDARFALTSAVAKVKDCTVLRASDVEEELRRAAVWVVEQHQAAVDQQRARLADAEQALQEAAAANSRAAREAALAATDISRFDELANHLNTADEAYEASVHADAEAARSLAAALGELERILGQRHTATASLEQARSGRDKRAVPDAVIQQAITLQVALSKAEAERRAAVQQADEDLQVARRANAEALSSLEQAHSALRAGLQTLNASSPPWADGVPLPGLIASFHDRLADALAAAEAAAAQAKSVENGTRARLEQESRELESLFSAGPPELDPLDTAVRWVGSDLFMPEEVVFADDAFSQFGREGATTLTTALASRGCQVVYLTEDPEMLGWAISLPREAGGVSTISSSSRHCKPALVND